MSLTPSTELDAVNTMLSVLGESPVSTLENVGAGDVLVARQILNNTSREVQSVGWYWNTDIKVTLVPTNTQKELLLPLNTLKVTPTVKYSADIVQRGGRLWDRKNNTFRFDEPLDVDLVRGLAFDQMPEYARYYITIRAGRKFQERVLGSDTLSAFSERDEVQALITLQQAECDTGDYNLMNNYSVARILWR